MPSYLFAGVVQVLDDSLADTVSAPIPVIDLLQLFIVTSVQLPFVHLPYFEIGSIFLLYS